MTTKPFPKFSQKITDSINLSAQQTVQNNIGVIVGYDPVNNTASVIATNRGSEIPGEMFHNVPCPRPMGVQSVAPEQGCQCFLSFKDGKRANPIIISYHNTTSYALNNYSNETTAQVNTPSYLFGI
jgi:phage gp45-like